MSVRRSSLSTPGANFIANSLPALATALRLTGAHAFVAPDSCHFTAQRLVPMYQIDGTSSQTEVQDGIRVLDETMERIRRLSGAYGEWQHFDAGAYFDLTDAQSDYLVRVSERVSTVHVRFAADLLLPSFRQAVTYWRRQFTPAYLTVYGHAEQRSAHGEGGSREIGDRGSEEDFQIFYAEIQPRMIEHWQQTMAVVAQVRRAMQDDPAFLATNAAMDEWQRWREQWRNGRVPGLDETLTPPLQSIPTLTLAFEFPLPAHRQPGRIRRLRRQRARRLRQRRPRHP